MSSLPVPKRGELWLIGFDQTVGSEINKTRPAVDVSSDSVGSLDVKLIVPLTGWQDSFQMAGDMKQYLDDVGYDGVIYTNRHEARRARGSHRLFIALYPQQIRSVFAAEQVPARLPWHPARENAR